MCVLANLAIYAPTPDSYAAACMCILYSARIIGIVLKICGYKGVPMGLGLWVQDSGSGGDACG